jgi:uncharacterized membrane protein
MSYGKIQELMRKTRRSKGRKAEFYVIDISQVAKQPAEVHNGEELIANQHKPFWSLLYDDYPEFLRPMNSPHVSR